MGDWIRAICRKDEARPALAEPFGVTLGETRYVCAVDGIVAAFVAGDAPDGTLSTGVAKVARDLFREDGRQTCRLDDLRAWCRDGLKPLPDPESPCPKCDGVKKAECAKCDGTGTCDSCDCGAEHDCGACNGSAREECSECEGSGKYGEGSPRDLMHIGALVRGSYVDRRALLRLIDKAPGETVSVRVAKFEEPIAFAGDGWHGLAMQVYWRDAAPEFDWWSK